MSPFFVRIETCLLFLSVTECLNRAWMSLTNGLDGTLYISSDQFSPINRLNSVLDPLKQMKYAFLVFSGKLFTLQL